MFVSTIRKTCCIFYDLPQPIDTWACKGFFFKFNKRMLLKVVERQYKCTVSNGIIYVKMKILRIVASSSFFEHICWYWLYFPHFDRLLPRFMQMHCTINNHQSFVWTLSNDGNKVSSSIRLQEREKVDVKSFPTYIMDRWHWIFSSHKRNMTKGRVRLPWKWGFR